MRILQRTLVRLIEKPWYIVSAWVICIVALVVALGFFIVMMPSRTTIPKQPTAQPASDIHKSKLGLVTDAMQVSLSEKNNSGETGKVTLKEINDKVYLEVVLTGMVTKEPQPAYVYEGSCNKPGAQLYSLSPVINGKTANYLKGSLADFKKQFPVAIRVHKSTQDISNDVVCAELTKS